MNVAEMSKTTQYLSFNLADEVFAIDIGKVREVLDFTTVTKVPKTPEFMRGVINLRGSVVPVIDLRRKFGMSMTESTVYTCIVIVEVALDNESIVLGALADSVQEVFDLNHDEIEPAPKIGTLLNTDFLKGMGKKNEEFILLLEIDKVFYTDELEAARQMAKQSPDALIREGLPVAPDAL